MTTTGLLVLLGLAAFAGLYLGFKMGFRSACEAILATDGRMDFPEMVWERDRLRRMGRLREEYDNYKNGRSK